MAHALIPLKKLTEAKTRLAGLLPSPDRQALVQAMAHDVMAVLSKHQGIMGVTLLSDDPVAPLLANRHGARCWPEHELGCTGLNAGLAAASDRLLREGEPVLIVHADLPLLHATDISAALEYQRALSGLVVGCDETGSGTNLLVFDTSSRPEFCFGDDSCARHIAWAEDANLPVQRLQRPGIALDVDSPRDVLNLLDNMPLNTLSATATFLRRGPGRRIKAALASLPPLTGTADTGQSIQSYA